MPSKCDFQLFTFYLLRSQIVSCERTQSNSSKAAVAEWLRRLTRNQLCSARTGSNPVGSDYFFRFLSKTDFSGAFRLKIPHFDVSFWWLKNCTVFRTQNRVLHQPIQLRLVYRTHTHKLPLSVSVLFLLTFILDRHYVYILNFHWVCHTSCRSVFSGWVSHKLKFEPHSQRFSTLVL